MIRYILVLSKVPSYLYDFHARELWFHSVHTSNWILATLYMSREWKGDVLRPASICTWLQLNTVSRDCPCPAKS